MSTLTPWSPLRELTNLENRLERFLGAALPFGHKQNEAITASQWIPLVDITEDEKEYLVKVELPDIRREDIKVTLEDGELTISGERKFEKEEKNKKYHRIERSYGSFLRSFTLPGGVSGDKVLADFKHGVLKIHLPKNDKARQKSVEVKVQ